MYLYLQQAIIIRHWLFSLFAESSSEWSLYETLPLSHNEDFLYLYRTGSDDSEQLVEVLVAVLEAIRSLFGLLADNQLSTLPQCASLLLK